MQYTLNKVMMLLGAAVLAGCGGGSGGGTASDSTSGSVVSVQTGQFVDAPTEGLRYVSGDQSGITDEKGTFKYVAGNKVKFYVGDILLGEATAASVITPIQLVAGAQDVNHQTVTNIVRFLTTLDDDANPANGIVISDAVSKAAAAKTINFAQATTDFAATGNDLVLINDLTKASTAGIRTLTTTADAQGHAKESIKDILAGAYSGSFGGSDSGSWTGTLKTDGTFSGTGQSQQAGAFTFSGTVLMDGSGKADFTSAGSVSTGTVFSGKINANGTASGQWNFMGQQTGTWTGKLTQRTNTSMLQTDRKTAASAETAAPAASSGTTSASTSTTTPSTTTTNAPVTTTANTTPAQTTSTSSGKYKVVGIQTLTTGEQYKFLDTIYDGVEDKKPVGQAEFCEDYAPGGTIANGGTCTFDGTTGTVVMPYLGTQVTTFTPI